MISSLKTFRLDNLLHADSIAISIGATAVASVVARLIGLARGVALAWLIPPAQFGLFGVALLVVNVLLPVCSAGLYEGVARYAPRHESGHSLRRFVFRSFITVGVIAVATTAILGLLGVPIGSALFSTARTVTTQDIAGATTADLGALMRACLVCVLALAIYHTLLGLLRGWRMFRAVGVAELIVAGLFTGVAVVGAAGGLTTARALMLVYALACAACCLAFAPGLFRRVTRVVESSGESPSRPASSLVAFSVWAAGSAVLWHALAYYPMWYLLKVSGPETVGTFHAVRIITQLVQVGAVMLTGVVAANVNRLWEHQGRAAAAARLTLLTKACLIALIAGATLLSVCRPILMRVLPEAFHAGEAAYGPLVLFFLLVGIVGLVAVRLNLVEKPRWVCLAWSAGVVINVVMSFVLLGGADASVPDQGEALRAAAWAGVAGVTTALLVCTLVVWREGLALDVRTVVLIIAAASVGFGWIVAVAVLLVLLVLASTTTAIFPSHERAGTRPTPADRADR